MSHQQLFDLFNQCNIDFTNHEHEPVFTVEEGLHLQKIIPGAHSKNLFLRNKKKSFYCLVSVIEDKIVDIKKLSDELGEGRLSFGSPEDMLAKINLTPGSVSPYGLIFDKEKSLAFILDKDFLNFEYINFHPLKNDMTVTVLTRDFMKFIEHIGHQLTIKEIPTKPV